MREDLLRIVLNILFVAVLVVFLIACAALCNFMS